MKKFLNIVVLVAILLTSSIQIVDAQPYSPDASIDENSELEGYLKFAHKLPFNLKLEDDPVTLTLGMEKHQIAAGENFSLSWQISLGSFAGKENQLSLQICVPAEVNPVGETEKEFNGETGCWNGKIKDLQGEMNWQVSSDSQGIYAISGVIIFEDNKITEDVVEFEVVKDASEIHSIEIVLDQDAFLVKNKNKLTSSLTIEGLDFEKSDKEAFLEICLLENIEFENQEQSGIQVEENGCYRQPVYSAEFSFDWKILEGDFSEATAIVYFLYIDGNIRANEVVSVIPNPTGKVEKDKDGLVEAKDGKLKIKFPQNAAKQDMDISVLSEWNPDSIQSIVGTPIHLNAFQTETGEQIKQFEDEIVLEFSYAGTEVEEDPASFKWKYFSEYSERWIAIRTEFDYENKIIRGYTNHFSAFEIDPDESFSMIIPALDSAEVSDYTGGASYSVPIPVPASAGGYTPSVAIVYNSQSVDGISSQTQASEVGMGWSLLAGGRITRTMHNKNTTNDDMFALELGGASYKLVPVSHAPDNSYVEYKTYNDTFMTIRRYRRNSGDLIKYWVVFDKAGNKYTFDNPNFYIQGEYTQLAYAWNLTEVMSSIGKTTTYLYDDVLRYSRTIESRLVAINYPDNHTKILFNWNTTDRTDYNFEWWGNYVPHRRSRIANIQTIYDPSSTTSGDETVINTTELVYFSDETSPIFPAMRWEKEENQLVGRTLVLKDVITKGKDGGELKKISFDYADSMHLTKIKNNAGADVEFEYEAIPWHITEPYNPKTIFYFGNPFFSQGQYYVMKGSTGYDFSYPGQANWIRCKLYSAALYPYTAKVFIDTNSSPSDSSAKFITDSITPVIYEVNQETGTTWHEIVGIVIPNPESLPITTWAGIVPSSSTWNTKINACLIESLLTRYRVETKTVTDHVTGNSFSYSYTYTGASDNNTGNSNILQETVINKEKTKVDFGGTEFRGHATSTTIDNFRHLKTVTYYHQDDARKGMAYKTELYDIENPSQPRLISKSLMNYPAPTRLTGETNIDYCAHNDTYNWCYLDDTTYYVTLLASKEEYFDSVNGSIRMGTKQTYSYDAYGNVTQVITAELNADGTTWTNRTLSKTGFSLYSSLNSGGNTYLPSLPTYTAMYDCPNGTCSENNANLLSFTCNVYGAGNNTICGIKDDGSVNVQQPQSPILSRSRSLLYFADRALYRYARYSDSLFGLDAWGNVTTSYQYSQEGTNYEYASTGAVLTTAAYDNVFHNRVTSESVSLSTSVTATTTYTYNGYCQWFGKPSSMLDANGNTTSQICDQYGRVTEVRQPGDESGLATMTAVYTKFQNNSAPTNIQVKTNLDDVHQLTTTSYANGLGQIIQTRQAWVGAAEHLVTKVGYDHAGRQVMADVEPQLVSTSTGYYTGAFGFVVETEYDALDRVVRITNPEGTEIEYQYDVVNHNGEILLQQTAIDPDDNNKETYTFTNVFGQVVEVSSNFSNMVVLYEYDPVGNLIQVRQNKNSSTWLTTSITYDNAGRKITMVDPDMGTWTYKYDALGNLKEQLDAKNIRTCMWYDLSGRLTGKQYRTDGSACSSKPADSPTTPNYAYFHYDESGHGESIGRLTSASNNVLTIDTSYDVKGQITNTTYDYHLITGPNYSFGYSYTANGAPLSITYPDGEVLTYGYDNRGLLKSVFSDVSGDMVGGVLDPAQYDTLGRTTSLPLKGFEITYNYKDATDPSGMMRLDDILVESNSETTLLYLSFENYDKKGNLITLEDMFGGVSENIIYGYDNLSRLTTVTSTNGPDGAYSLAYTYDPYNGNLLNTTEDGFTQTRSYGNANHPHAVTGYQGNTYAYDANGNMTTRIEDGINYTQEWNAYNMLRRVSWIEGQANHTVTYGYDANGTRVVKIHKMVEGSSPVIEKTTLYVGGQFEFTITTTSYDYTAQFAALN